MKRITITSVLLLITLLTLQSKPFRFNGELYFQGITKVGFTTTGTVQKASNTNAYYWNSANETVELFTSGFNYPIPGLFDSPKDINSAPNWIPWGIFNVNYTIDRIGYSTIYVNFTINTLDENWSTSGYNDFIVEFVTVSSNEYNLFLTFGPTNSKIQIAKLQYSGNSGWVTYYNNSVNLWSVVNATPNQSHFDLMPVQLINKVENTAYQFGVLSANGKNIASGDNEPFKANDVSTVSHGTVETEYNGKRNYSFKWNNINVNAIVGQSSFNSIENFTVNNSFNSKSITRTFRPVYQLTVKNLLEGSSNSGGSFLFKDPVTNSINGVSPTNFVSKSAAGNGYINQEAFEGLNERIGTDTTRHQYSLKAVSSFTDGNGIKWQWQSGDFNPTTATDLLLTGNTTKTANYKGILTSNTPNWVENNMENFNGTEAVLYPSMNELWLHIEEIS